MNLQNKNWLTDLKIKLMVTKGETWEENTSQYTGIDIYTLLYINQITNKNLMYSTGNSTQYSVKIYVGKESEKKMDIYIYITDSFCYTPETNTTL